MGKKESLTFDNIAADDSGSVYDNTNSPGGSFKRGRGIYISPVWIFIYILISIALALIVGLIVHFAHPGRNRVCEYCTNDKQTADEMSLDRHNFTWEICVNMSKQLNECLPVEACPPDTSAITTETAPTSGPAAPITGYRLPTTLKPFHYNVDIRADIYQDYQYQFGFSGHVNIFLVCVEETDVIVVNFKLLFIDEDSISVVDMNTQMNISVKNTSKSFMREFLYIYLNENLTEGQQVMVDMIFYGQLFSDMRGMYWSSYPENGTTKYMMSTQFESADARKAFPCLDEPQLKATFNVSLWRKEQMIALSNMPRYHTEYIGDGWVKDYFLQTPVPLPTYLMAFAIADYDYIDATTTGGQTISNRKYMRIFSRPSFIADGFANYASFVSVPIFDYFEEYFNHSYPLPKTDQITVPNFSAGAMENWGLITYRETRLLVDPRYTSQYDIWRFTRTIAHELLHQWLGNTVTVAWWDDIWLQEGAARYFEGFAVQHARPEWNQTITYMAMTFHWALGNDDSGDSHPLYNPGIEKYTDLESMFSIMTYDKGSTVFRMIHQYIFRDHPDEFDQAMRQYIQNNLYSNVQHNDLLQEFEKAAVMAGINVNVTDVVYTWIKQMGYPVVTFKRSNDGSTVHVTQKMFLLDSTKPLKEKYPSPYNYSWEVPLSYYSSVDPTPTFDWLHKENKTITLTTPLGKDDWLIGNYHQLGFYRVNYDDITWEAILKQLTSNHKEINVIQRGQILDDAFDMGRAMVTDQLYALRATEYLQNETEYLPWYAAMHGIKYTEMVLSNLPQYGMFRRYMTELVKKNYQKYGWEKQENLIDGFLQVHTISRACKFGIQDCVRHSVEIFKQWMEQPDNLTIIRTDYRSTVYCISMKSDASEASWEFLFQQYQLVDHELERSIMRDALGCALQTWVLHRYFAMGAQKDARIHHLDTTAVMRAVSRNYPSGTMVAFDYLSQNWYNMSSTKFHILSDIIDRYSTEYDQTKFEDFVRHHPSSNSAEERAYKDMRYTIKANIKWRELNEQKIIDWLIQARQRQLDNLS